MNKEINKFNDMAAQWWDLEGPAQPLHKINPLRLQFIENHVSLANKKVLDIGCGGGILTESLARAKARPTGIDLAEDLLSIAQEHAASQGLSIDYQCISVESFAKAYPAQFDVITCMEMLEHVDDPATIIHACQALLKPGGYLFLSTLNRNPKSFLLAIIGAEYIMNMIPKGTHEYAKFITPAEMGQLLREETFDIIQIKGLRYRLLHQTFELSNDCDVNYLMCAQLSL